MATWQAVNRMRVGERYEIEETIEGTKEIERRVVERGRRERARFYDPWEFPEIVSEFATKVQFNDDAGLLDFTHRWGSLRETLDITRQVPGGDRVGDAEQHAAIVRFSLELIALIRDGDADGVDRFLQSDWPKTEIRVKKQLFYHQTEFLHSALQEKGLCAGSEVLAGLINSQIEPVGPVFQPTVAGPPIRVTKATNLLQVIYCHLADAWEGKTGYYKCAKRGCPHWWPRDRETRGPKPKYCPPAGRVGESLCSRQERYYRSRKV